MHTKRAFMSLAMVVAISATGINANAGGAVMASSGRPFNNTPVSNFNISDTKVTYSNGNTWIIPIMVPLSYPGTYTTYSF